MGGARSGRRGRVLMRETCAAGWTHAAVRRGGERASRGGAVAGGRRGGQERAEPGEGDRGCDVGRTQGFVFGMFLVIFSPCLMSEGLQQGC